MIVTVVDNLYIVSKQEIVSLISLAILKNDEIYVF